MKKLLLILILPLLLCACNTHSAEINSMAEEINSPHFRAKQAKTGLFDDTKAEIDGQNFVVSFLTRPFINLGSIDQNQYGELEQSCITDFRSHLIDPTFKKGIEALAAENMNLLMVWQDVNGNKITIAVDPQKVLSDNPGK